jgi:protein-S-isoprenylcysteine O-methyltransferase Ste14
MDSDQEHRHPEPDGSTRATGALSEGPPPATIAPEVVTPQSFLNRDLFVRVVEQVIFVTAVVGAVALGLGITDYLGEHRYVAGYLLAYVGFRFADLMVGEDIEEGIPVTAGFKERVLSELPILILFAAAPFERTYLYGGEPAAWLQALGLLLELTGLWLALGSRIQLHFFSSDRSGRERTVLVKTGFYKYIRHPVYAGVLLLLLAWPLLYGAWIVVIVTIVIGGVVAHRQIAVDEEVLLGRFGEEFEEYRRTTDALIPSVW